MNAVATRAQRRPGLIDGSVTKVAMEVGRKGMKTRSTRNLRNLSRSWARMLLVCLSLRSSGQRTGDSLLPSIHTSDRQNKQQTRGRESVFFVLDKRRMVAPTRRWLISRPLCLAILTVAAAVLTEHLKRVNGFVPSRPPSVGDHRPPLLYRPSCQSLAQRSSLQVLTGREDVSMVVEGWKDNHTEVLWAYVSQLQRLRRKNQSGRQTSNQATKKPARSLLYFLSERQWDSVDISVREPLHRALIQAMRWAKEENDYRLIQQLIGAAMQYAGTTAALLDPRLLGEAVRSLASTSASLSKVKAIWGLAPTATVEPSNSSLGPWERPVGPMEVNAMLQALERRHKVRACLEMVVAWEGYTDAYSLSIVLNALRESVVPNQSAANATSMSNTTTMSPRLQSLQSPCWQWNEAIQLLEGSTVSMEVWNNPAVSALLQLNEKAQSVFPRHGGSFMAVAILDWMHEIDLSPDQQTCTLILSSLDRQWPLARTLILQPPENNQTDAWRLPAPNAYMYSAAMSICARNGQYSVAIELLEQLATEQSDSVKANTWVYNSLLQAFVPRNHWEKEERTKIRPLQRRRAQERVQWALNLLRRMESFGTMPDVVTYNIMFSLLASVRPFLREAEWADLCQGLPSSYGAPGGTDPSRQGFQEIICLHILDKMCAFSIPRDVKTYRHVLQALQGAGRPALFFVLHRALEDCEACRGDERSDVFNAALGTLAAAGDLDGVMEVYSLMEANCARVKPESTAHLVTCLGHAGRAKTIPVLLLASEGQTVPAKHLAAEHGLRLQPADLVVDSTVFAAAIESCLAARDFTSAKRVLVQMQDKDIQPSEESLRKMAKAYAFMATMSRKSRGDSTDYTASSRAVNAYSIVKTMEDAPVSLLSVVSKACGATGVYEEAQSLLRMTHKKILERRIDEKDTVGRFAALSLRSTSGLERVVTDLHRSLLRSCAIDGNVTVALRICEDIQYLSRQLSWTDDFGEEGPILVSREQTIGMGVQEWKYLLTAASKSGHWKVCLSTLQILRPYLEAAHPSRITDKNEADQIDRGYGRLEPMLSTAVACLAIRGQYAWIVRVIDDWIEWSGRRPPKAAVFVAARSLSSRGRGAEVNSLLARCTSVESPNKAETETDVYAAALFAGAISVLYNDGLYDAADDLFVTAICQEHLPFYLKRQAFGAENRITLDLHGMNVAVAHSAVRIALQREVASASRNVGELWDNDLMIVTGRGKRSAASMRPVVRPEVQRMLLEEFYPPLSTISVPGNMGALRVSSDEIADWLDHQKEQKGARMQSIAALLKGLSSGNRIRVALARAADSNPPGDRKRFDS